MLNFSFLFGDELRLRALHAGASAAMAANPIWALTVTGGFVSNLVYCVYLLNRNKTWSVYRERSSLAYWSLGISTGLLWFGGTILYGVGAASLGSPGRDSRLADLYDPGHYRGALLGCGFRRVEKAPAAAPWHTAG
jgi:L-rhamnose-H+ transport protein